MDINGVLHFTPLIPFKDVNWDGDKLPEQFRQRIEGFYLEPAAVSKTGMLLWKRMFGLLTIPDQAYTGAKSFSGCADGPFSPQ